VMAEVSIQVNEEGRKRATAVTSTTTRVMCAAIHAERVMILFFMVDSCRWVFMMAGKKYIRLA